MNIILYSDEYMEIEHFIHYIYIYIFQVMVDPMQYCIAANRQIVMGGIIICLTWNSFRIKASDKQINVNSNPTLNS